MSFFKATVAILFLTILVSIGLNQSNHKSELAAVDALNATGIIPKDGRNWCADPDRDKSKKCIGPSMATLKAAMNEIKCKTLSSEVQSLCSQSGYDSVVANKDGWVQKRLAYEQREAVAAMNEIKCKTLSSEVQSLCSQSGYDSVVANKDGWVQKRLAREKARSQQWVDEYNMIIVLNSMGANLPLPSLWRR